MVPPAFRPVVDLACETRACWLTIKRAGLDTRDEHQLILVTRTQAYANTLHTAHGVPTL